MFKKFWNWGVVGAAVFFLWGGGITFMTSNLFTLADIFYIAGAALLIAKFVTWEEHLNKPLRDRIRVSLVITLIIGCVLVLAVWENHHLKNKAEQALKKAEEPKIAYVPTPIPAQSATPIPKPAPSRAATPKSKPKYTAPTANPSPTAGPTPILQEVRLIGVREIPSELASAPYGLELSFQTTVPLQPILYIIKCANPVTSVGVMPSSDYSGFVSFTMRPLASGETPEQRQETDTPIVRLNSPAFEPDRAMIVRLFSKTKNSVISWQYQAGHPR